MENHIEQYQAKQGGVTLHTWTEVQGGKKDNFYITGVSGTPVAAWFRTVLRTKHLADIAVFPASPSDFYAYRASASAVRPLGVCLGRARRATNGA